MSDLYADIRPFNDDEVEAVIERLLTSDELLAALLKYKFPTLPGFIKPLLKPFLFSRLRREFSGVNNIENFQLWLEPKVQELLQRTCSEVVVEGLDSLDIDKTHVWISNHRDIAMDPTMVNYSLHQAGWPTSRIAIGDNLLNNPVFADVMRLNKSFVVKRSVENKRQKLKELQRLSAYIRDSVEDGASVWIAQREGRAKDNRDQTDTAVLKMLALHGRPRKESFAECMQQLNPVPVSIQYEWDPCDVMKAAELVSRADSGEYQKQADEDERSILTGLLGVKGRVKVCFGQPLTAEQLEDADIMARSIDQQISEMHDILPVHCAALELLKNRFNLYNDIATPAVTEFQAETARLIQRTEGLDTAVQKQLLRNYAAPLL